MRNRRLLATVLITLISLATILISIGSGSAHKDGERQSQPQHSFGRTDNLKPIPGMIKDSKALGADFLRRDLFHTSIKSVSADPQLRQVVSNGVVLDLNKTAVQEFLNERAEFVTLPLPDGKGGTIELELVKVDIFASGFSVETAKPTTEKVDENLGVHYRGIAKGNDHSLAAISVFNDEVMGFYSTEADGNSILGRLGGNNPTDKHILYADKDLKINANFHCDTPDTDVPLPVSDLQEPEEVAARCIRIYLEADYDLFLNKGSVANTVSYLTGVFNQSATLYSNDSIPISMSDILVWNVPSPYAGLTTTSALLAKFQEIRNSFNGDIGHLIAIRGNGGLAAGFDAFCNVDLDAHQCFSGIYSSYSNVPTYSWTVSVFTHEMGHLLGSRHTHACVWNGNNTAIDSCGPTAGYPYEGTCSGASLPAGGGTIMSYCHLVSGVGINFTLGFGSQPRNVIVNKFNAATCLVDCSPTCTYSINPTSLNLPATSGNGSLNLTTGPSCPWTVAVNAPALVENSSSSRQENSFRSSKELVSQVESANAQVAPETVFLNSTPITINDRPTNSSPPATASLYPSTIAVSGLTGTITQVTAALNGLSHTFPDDVDVLLVGPGGQRSILMSDAGGGSDLVGVNLTFDQSAAALPDDTQISSGTFRPSNFNTNTTLEPGGIDNFPSPGPGQAVYGSDLSVFNGTAPNGTWQLFVVDDENVDAGSIATGWALGITTTGGGTTWIHVTPPTSGTGPATISYTVDPNTGANSRTGTITVGGQVHTVIQAGGTDLCAQSIPISVGQTLNGTLTASDCLVLGSYYTDNYSFNGTAGQQIVISMNSASLDSYLVLRYPNGTILTEDNDGGGGSNARIPPTLGTYTLPTTGPYIIEASTAPAFQTGTYSVTLSGGSGGAAVVPPADFDGDFMTDISVFRPSNGGWYIQQSLLGFTGIAFGVSTDKPTPGDFDGDGKTDVAVFRPSTGTWYLLRSQLGFFALPFGANGDLPGVGDFDHDGKADIGVFRPSNGTWYIQRSQLGFFAMGFGANGDVPVVGDYDGDGTADIAVFRQSTGGWYIQRSSLGFTGISFGAPGDKPVPGDYDGDGKTDCAVWRPSNGTWYVQGSQLGFFAYVFGTNGDKPAPGDYDGDHKTDYAVFRPTTGGYYVQRSQLGFLGQSFGTNGDIPLPGAYVP